LLCVVGQHNDYSFNKLCTVRGYCQQFIQFLIKYHWPGNVRELPPASLVSGPATQPTRNLEEIEKREIAAALPRHGWVQARATRELGLTQRQIGYKINKYQIVPPDYLR
jgi:transcriptional regulator with GAF, ATPase, and Fis domain